MKKTIVVNKKISKRQLENMDRIYIGNDYCENALNFLSLSRLISFYSNKRITLLLPFLTDKSFNKLQLILNKLEVVNSKHTEVVFNDWGAFYYLRNYYPKMKLVMGRLLTKQKKDPRADIILRNKQNKFNVFLSKDNNKKIVYTKKVPKSLVDIFSRHSVETKEIFDFLSANNVSRIEIDNIIWEMISDIPKNIHVSLYYPYIFLTVTRYCGAMNGEYKRVCNMNCKKKAVLLDNNFYVKGNAVYHKNETLPNTKNLKSNNIDRIVYQQL